MKGIKKAFKAIIPALIVCLQCFAGAAFASAPADESYKMPFLSKFPDQALLSVPLKIANPNPKTYVLPATPATSQWGFFDNQQPPVLKIKPGDSVVFETMAASDNQVIPGATIEQIIKIQNEVPGRGPHTVTGPVYIEGAEPGDTLQIRFNKIVPRPYASNNTAPGKGLFPEEFPKPRVRYFYLDAEKKQMQFAPGIIVPLAPFPGVVAVAPAEAGKFDTAQPGRFGGNMDLREMTEGATLYLPVFVKGALLWTGDSHAAQGNGEINLTAVETAFQEFNITVDVIKKKSLAWPRVETPSAWIAVGYDRDLNKAFDILQEETIKLIVEQKKVSPGDARKIMMETWNCPIAEVVNGVQGTYCMLPKQANAPKHALLANDDENFFVTRAQDSDLEQAMKKASMAMLKKVSAAKKLSLEDAYALASFALDCRIAPYESGEKEVNCAMPKSLWMH